MLCHQINCKSIEKFLKKVDKTFPVPLSEKQNLSTYANKLFHQATICAETEHENLLSMVAGYTENLSENMAYIAVVATVPEAYGRGLAEKCVRAFLAICQQKQIAAVHLYTSATNHAAINMYQKIGFRDYVILNEPRPEDRHLIYDIT